MIENILQHYRKNFTFQGAVYDKLGPRVKRIFKWLMIIGGLLLLVGAVVSTWYFPESTPVVLILMLTEGACATGACFYLLRAYKRFLLDKYPVIFRKGGTWSGAHLKHIFLEGFDEWLNQQGLKTYDQLKTLSDHILKKASLEKLPYVLFISVLVAIILPVWVAFVNAVFEKIKSKDVFVLSGWTIGFCVGAAFFCAWRCPAEKKFEIHGFDQAAKSPGPERHD